MQQTSKVYFNTLSIIHTALVIGQVLFALVAWYMNSQGPLNVNPGLNEILQFIVPVLIVSGVSVSSIVYRTRLKSIKEKGSLKEKLTDYRSALILRYAILEGPSLFAIISYLLTSNNLFLALAGLTIVMFFINRPSKFSAANDMELDQMERVAIEDPEAIVC